jgi:hypothetical protein|tara:strand:- start:341 stop:523 length:183 start_codon:yes stop_codon:yes gene_type:complete
LELVELRVHFHLQDLVHYLEYLLQHLDQIQFLEVLHQMVVVVVETGVVLLEVLVDQVVEL